MIRSSNLSVSRLCVAAKKSAATIEKTKFPSGRPPLANDNFRDRLVNKFIRARLAVVTRSSLSGGMSRTAQYARIYSYIRSRDHTWSRDPLTSAGSTKAKTQYQCQRRCRCNDARAPMQGQQPQPSLVTSPALALISPATSMHIHHYQQLYCQTITQA